jgi:hypothetical protein
MQKVVSIPLVKAVFFICLMLSAAGPLSGCAVVAPLLSVGGLAYAPLQYVSTAYTIGSFTYEYAANDKTPDEVIEDNYHAIVSGDAFDLPEYLRPEVAGPAAPVMTAEAAPSAGNPALSEEARRKRIENLLGQRRVQFQRLELRRMAFLRANPNPQNLTFKTAMAASPDLVQAAESEVSLD